MIKGEPKPKIGIKDEKKLKNKIAFFIYKKKMMLNSKFRSKH